MEKWKERKEFKKTPIPYVILLLEPTSSCRYFSLKRKKKETQTIGGNRILQV